LGVSGGITRVHRKCKTKGKLVLLLCFKITFKNIYYMLKWSAIFFVIAIIAAIFGFTGIAAGAASIAKFLFGLFIVIFLIFFILGVSIFKK
jgi:uncharacterized membrane protein YtjA (UPF0391 family)